jgi:hypothetical protein
MIRNEEEYERTLRWIENFETAYRETELATNIEPKIKQATLDAYRSQIEDLQREVDEYERNRGN